MGIDVSDDRLNVSAVDGLVASFLNTEFHPEGLNSSQSPT